MKIIIAGDGKVGATLARQLSAEGNDITLIDSNERVLENIVERYDVISVNGNCASMNVLQQAEIETADILIATTSADEVNLLCCMTAHSLNPNIHTIARIRNPEYSEQIYEMRDVFGLSLDFNPERQTASEIERLLEFPGFLKRDSFAKDRVEIVELKVGDDSRLNGAALHSLNSIVKCKVLVCAVLRGGKASMPDGNFVLRSGDRIFVSAPTNVLALLLKNLGIITKKINSVMLTGGGRVSYYLARRLLKSGMAVRIIEQDHARCVELAKMLPGADIINGDASNQEFLEREGMGECDALVSVTGLDELNVIISLYATEIGVPQVITKLSRSENLNIMSKLAIGSVVCPKELSCGTVVRYVRAMQKQTGAALSVHSIASGQAEASEFLVDEETLNCGVPLKRLRLRRNVLIACISHVGETEIPDGDSVFHQGDTVVVVTNSDTVILQLNDIFE